MWFDSLLAEDGRIDRIGGGPARQVPPLVPLYLALSRTEAEQAHQSSCCLIQPCIYSCQCSPSYARCVDSRPSMHVWTDPAKNTQQCCFHIVHVMAITGGCCFLLNGWLCMLYAHCTFTTLI